MSDLAGTPNRTRPGASVSLDIRQGRARAWRAIPFELIVRNPTPRDISVDFDARDARGLCTFKLPRPLTIPAGLQATTRLWAKPSRKRIIGPAGMIPFLVTAFEPDGRAAEVAARLPDLALGALPLLLGVAGLAVVVGTASAGAMLASGGDDGGASTSLAGASATLTEAVARASTKGPATAEPSQAATAPPPTAAPATPAPTTPAPAATATPTQPPTATPTPTPTPTQAPAPPPPPPPPPTGTGGTFAVSLFCTEVGCTGPGGSLRPQGCTAGLMRSYARFTLDSAPATVVVRWSGSNGPVAEATFVEAATSGQSYIDVKGSFGADTYTVSWSVGDGGPLATSTLTLTC